MLVKVFVAVFVPLLGAQVVHASDECQSLMEQGRALQREGKYSDAIRALHAARTLADTSGADQRRVAEISESLGATYADAGQIANAEREYRRSLAAIKNFEGAQSLDYAVVLATAEDLRTGNEIGEDAMNTLREALAKHGETGTTDRLAVIRLYLADMLSKKGRYREAELLLLDALTTLKKESNPDPKLKGGLVNALGVLLFKQRRYGEALESDMECLQHVQTLRGDHPSMVLAWNNVAMDYLMLGRLNESISAFENSVSIASRVLDGANPVYGNLLSNYAFVLRKAGRKSEAKAIAQKSKQMLHNGEILNGTGSTVSLTALRSPRD